MSREKKDFEGRVLIASLAVLSGFYLIQTLTGWWFLANSGIRGPYRFLDLKLVLKSFDCYPIVGDQVFASPTDDPCRGYIYGRQFLYLMANLNVGENLSNLIAIIFAISFLIIAAGIISTYPSSRNATLLGLLVFLSPSCWLLIERMNLDILILLFVAIAVLFIRHKKSEIAVIFLLLSALVKFYTFPLALVTLLFIQNGKRRILSAFLVLFTGTLLITEIVKIPRFPGTWYVSFGNQIVGQWWNLLISERNLNWYRANSILASLVGMAFILAGTLISQKIYGKSARRISETLGKQIVERDISALIYIYSIMILLICYFSGMNYDYRLFYLGIIPIVIYRASRTEKYLFRTLVGATLLSLWMSCFFYGLQGIRVVLLELAGDIFTGIAVSINLLLLIHVISAIWRISKTTPRKI